MSRIGKIARRSFLFGSVAIAGGVAFGYWKYRQPHENPLLKDLAAGEAALTPYVKVTARGVTIYSPRSEMGQGVATTLPALVAEELDIGLDQITVEHAPAADAYYNAAILHETLPFRTTDLGTVAEAARAFMDVPAKLALVMQATGGSSSVPDAYEKLRVAGAAARAVLVEAAAAELGEAPGVIRTERGEAIAPDGRSVAYTALASRAAGIAAPADVTLKDPADWRILGVSQPRTDMAAKCEGRAVFSLDTRPEGLLYAAVRLNPAIGGGMVGYDDAKAVAMRGVKAVVPIENGVAVVATNTWYAMEAAKAVEVAWGPAPYPLTTEEHFAEVAASFTEARRNSVKRDDGDVDAALGPDDKVHEYRAPYLAHATMEPLNATVHVTDEGVTVWTGTQNPTLARKITAKMTGHDVADVEVITTFLGGGFGRRGEVDYVRHAVTVAQAMKGVPVKTVYSREEDMCQDFYRPLAMARIRGKVDGRAISALDVKVAAPPVAEDITRRSGVPFAGPDPTIVMSTWDQPYDAPDFRVSGYRAPTMLPVGAWRSVGSSQNAFFMESAIDELATEAGVDPVELRLNSLAHGPSRKVVEAVAEMSGWGDDVAPGRARGVAFSLSFGVPAAEVVEIEDAEDGLRIRRVWAAVDVGVALDPRNIEAQVISAVNFGLSAAMTSEVTLTDGAVTQTNFHNYDAMRLYQAPEIEVRILENGEAIRGIGEPGTPPAAPALAAAIFALTGTRMRETPFSKFVRFA